MSKKIDLSIELYSNCVHFSIETLMEGIKHIVMEVVEEWADQLGGTEFQM